MSSLDAPIPDLVQTDLSNQISLDLNASASIDQELSGQLGSLDIDPYAVGSLKYPTDIQGLDTHIRNWITFYINEQVSGKYQTETVDQPIQDTVDQNMQENSAASWKNQASKQVQLPGGTMASQTTVVGGAAGAAAGFIGGNAIFGAGAGALVGSNINEITQRPKTKRLKTCISIYMPDTVMTRQQQNWDSVSLTDEFGIVGEAVQMAGVLGDAFGRIKNSDNKMGQIKTELGNLSSSPIGAELKGQVTSKLSSAAGLGDMKDTKDLLLRSQGFALNPQVELLFKGTDRREFMFQFSFTPRSKKEAGIIQNIIKTFRMHAAPSLATAADGGSRYFIIPSTFDMKYYFDGIENPYLAKIGTCACTGVDVNYASTGKFIAFEDGSPLEIQVMLTFRELDIITRESIERGY